MQIFEDIITRNLYATDASMFRVLPKQVAIPQNENDISESLKRVDSLNIPIAARGAGTGLAGDSLTEGLVLDFSEQMNKIVAIDPMARRVVVQPGVVHAELNIELKKHGLIFGPDPATGNRATIGGMVANNSTGAHSLRYGMTMNWVRRLKVMLADGSVVDLSRQPITDVQHPSLLRVIELLKKNSQLIEDKWPDTPRNRHGYLLKDILQGDQVELYRLFVGSEGTLGIILEIELEVSPLPKYTKLICLCFDSRLDAARATDPLLVFKPSAVEIVDSVCLEMARTNPIYAGYFPSIIDSILMVELDGEDLSEIEEREKRIVQLMRHELQLVTDIIQPKNEREQSQIWQMRKLIAGMMNKIPGHFLPIPVIEDVCIHPRYLPQYFEKIDSILSARGLRFLCFGHAGDGTVHIRPFLNLRSEETYQWLPAVCDEVYRYTMSLKGTISGEHGDGYLRAPFIKLQYGELFEVFKELKSILDPNYRLNPDKQTGCIDFSRWTNNHKYRQVEPKYRPRLNFKAQKLVEMTEACNGCGECRSKLRERDMCPVYRALGVEAATTRAKANTLRAFLYGELPGVKKDDLKRLAKYCINCKRCEHDCPSNVKGGDLMLELKHLAGPSWKEWALCQMETGMRLGAYFPRLSNFFAKQLITRKALELFIGLDAKRIPPAFSTRSFRTLLHKYRWIKKYSPIKVAYFMDSFAELMDGDSARAFVAILKHHQIEVVVPKQKGSGIVPLNYGNRKAAEKIARYNIRELSDYLRNGFTVVCSEPSACLMLKDEYPLLVEGDHQELLSTGATDAMKFLYQLFKQGILRTDFKPLALRLGYHAPCHFKCISSPSYSLELLRLIPELNVEFIDTGCCGIAGTFGMLAKNRKTSLAIGSALIDRLSQDDIGLGCSECSTCRLQMSYGSGKKCLHPLEVLAQAYGLIY